eukprot:TRINITY_DN46790_c0_g1_i2.p1 TRINITY_DN46790_c0_g1~~TRINITY_DN46790_c0_g1_i2.p1  ORF type:complete len:360 (+),score=54.82 TRINITY_DN46790_c0_g1_i2:147-1226(+)
MANDQQSSPCQDVVMTSKRTEPSQEAGTEVECTICMETIAEGTLLPCQCKLDYCHLCWDKALANSFSQCGQARCPSCRTLVRIDFDPEKHCLVFTPETVDMTYAAENALRQSMLQDYMSYLRNLSTEEQQERPSPESFEHFVQTHPSLRLFDNIQNMRHSTINRLRHQAMPALIAALQRYSEFNPSLQGIHNNARETLRNATVNELKTFMEAACISSDDCTEHSDMVERLAEQVNGVTMCSIWAQHKCQPPKCVCGSLFQRVDAIERFRRSPAGERAAALTDDEVRCHLQHLQRQRETIIICDICEQPVPVMNAVWTCQNRTSTILHATSYDLCDGCFVEHTCSKECATSDKIYRSATW